jgi:hypothetical protein
MSHVLVATPTVYTDQPDDIPNLMFEISESEPDAVIIVMPRGMASPNRIEYLSHIANRLRDLHYVVDHREIRIDGRKQRVMVGQHRERGRRPEFPGDFGQLVLANQ